jgi:hypothetical protein
VETGFQSVRSRYSWDTWGKEVGAGAGAGAGRDLLPCLPLGGVQHSRQDIQDVESLVPHPPHQLLLLVQEIQEIQELQEVQVKVTDGS